ncbi:hypothetical protein WBG78_28290 [Chryseolinea sp. T2]|uniref:hypothetical protein n=1 Tax=Chryseolinea sp. T2 TaxID=3129255 RepID=UPI0030772FA7
MARAKNNVVLKGTSGQIGMNIVVKDYKDGRQVIANMPTKRKKTSAKQKANEDNFTDANSYAKHQMAIPTIADQYNRRAKGTTRHGYNLAVRDYSHPPKIHGIEAEEYKGQPGALIRVRATDDFKVVSVTVTITVGTKVIEKGEATPRGKRGLWRYTTTSRNTRLKGSVITAVAHDMPQHKATAYYSCSDGVVTWIESAKS